MLCEHAYYKTNDKFEKPCCNNSQKLAEDDFFKEACPLVYWCPIDEKFENTVDMFDCIYREKNNDKQRDDFKGQN